MLPETCIQIEEKLDKTKKEIYGNLTAWQRVQLSRHPIEALYFRLH